MKKLDPNKYVGIILIDGLCCKEELIMDKMGDLTNVTFIGGSAGDDLKFENTYVYANGKSYTHAAVLAILEPATEFSFIKTQSFCESAAKTGGHQGERVHAGSLRIQRQTRRSRLCGSSGHLRCRCPESLHAQSGRSRL